MGLQALPLHQFEYLVSCLRRASVIPAMNNLEESTIARLTIPDVLTPVQYYEGVRAQHPGTHAMKRLMLAVLEDALRCIQTYAENPNPVHRKAFAEAETWILDCKAQGPFAFGVICDVFGIESNRLRDGIREWRTQLSNGPDSRRLQRHPVRRNEPLGSLVCWRSNYSGPPRSQATQSRPAGEP